MGYAEIFDNYERFLNYLARLAAVKAQEVQRIAQTYMRPGNRVLGIYRPTENLEVPA